MSSKCRQAKLALVTVKRGAVAVAIGYRTGTVTAKNFPYLVADLVTGLLLYPLDDFFLDPIGDFFLGLTRIRDQV